MTRLIDADALLAKINNAEPINLGWITDQITNAPTVQCDANKIIEICLTKLSELKAPENYNAAESHIYEQAHSDCWKVVRKLLDSESPTVQREEYGKHTGWVTQHYGFVSDNKDTDRLNWLQLHFDSALTRENIDIAMISAAPTDTE